MDQDGQIGSSAQLPHEPMQSHDMVEMTVRQHDRIDVFRGNRQTAHVLNHPVLRHTGVKQDAMIATVVRKMDKSGKTVLGDESVEGHSTFHQWGFDNGWSAEHTSPDRWT